MKDLNISQVVKQTGISASTLRYYEDKNLISPIGRQGLKRLYDPSILQRLALISLGQAAGFTLDEIASMFSNGDTPAIKKNMLMERAEQIDKKIIELTSMREGLLHAAQCTAPSHMECPTFQRILKVAMTGYFRKKPSKILR